MNINGFSIGNIIREHDHEGYLYIYSSDVLYNGNVVGSYAENFMCGPSDLDLDEDILSEIRNVANKYFDKYPNGHPYQLNKYPMKNIYGNCIEEGLVVELASMSNLESDLSEGIKNGFKYIVCYKDNSRPNSVYKSVYIKNKKELTEFKKNNEIIYIIEDGCFNFTV